MKHTHVRHFPLRIEAVILYSWDVSCNLLFYENWRAGLNFPNQLSVGTNDLERKRRIRYSLSEVINTRENFVIRCIQRQNATTSLKIYLSLSFRYVLTNDSNAEKNVTIFVTWTGIAVADSVFWFGSKSWTVLPSVCRAGVRTRTLSVLCSSATRFWTCRPAVPISITAINCEVKTIKTKINKNKQRKRSAP